MKNSENKPLLLEGTLPAGVLLEETGGTFALSVPDRGMFEPPVFLTVRGPAKLRVLAGSTARARFVLNYETAAACDTVFELEAGAYVDVFHLDAHAGPQRLLVRSAYALKKHASLNVWTFTSGASAEIAHEVTFLEAHGFASLSGLSLLKDTSDVTHRVKADHRSGHCISRQFYKSILSQRARTAFESRVEVARGAEKSDSKQLNKNLLLSRDAQAVSRPELRIDADDVSCAHGSATGQLDPSSLFYLRSRGIAEDQARFMMIGGFAGEILEDIPEIPLKARLSRLVKDRIAEMAA